MKFTDEQKDLLALLPTTLKNSNELTDSSKLVLSNIIFLYGMEDAQKNGYVYRTNSKMMEETDIKSEHTLIGAVRLLELLGYIETTRGKRKEASTYKLLIDCSKKCSNNCSNENSLNGEIETLQNQVLLLQKQMVLLQKEIENLKNCSKKCSTDTESDTEKEYKKPVEQIPVVIKSIKEKKENEMNERSECNGMIKNGVERNDCISSTSGDKSQSSVINNNSLRERSVNAEETKENEMNVVNEMTNGVERNDCISSTTGNKSQSTVINNCSIFKENCPMEHPLTPNPFPPLKNNPSGCAEKRSMGQLPTEAKKVQQNAGKSPQTQFKPTKEEAQMYQYHLQGMMYEAPTVDAMQHAYMRLISWFNRMNSKYGETAMTPYIDGLGRELKRVSKINPVYSEWVKTIQ